MAETGADRTNSSLFKKECSVGKRYMGEILRDLDSQRRQGQSSLCDVVLQAEGKAFPAHKCVLAAASDYFRSMFHVDRFSESKSKEVELHLISADALERILDMIYTGTLKLDMDTVYSTVAAADQLMLTNVKTFCEQFLTEILTHWYPTIAQCDRSGDHLKTIQSSDYRASKEALKIKSCAEMYNLKDLSLMTEKVISANFEMIATTEDYLNLTLEEVCDLLLSDEMQITSEQALWEAAVRWLEGGDDPEARLKNTDTIMKSIRFPLMDPKVLLSTVRIHPTMSSAKCQRFVQEAIEYQLLPEERSIKQSSRTKPRCTANTTVIYCLAGSKNFLCFLPHKEKWYSLQAPLQTDAPLQGRESGEPLASTSGEVTCDNTGALLSNLPSDGDEYFHGLLSMGRHVYIRVLSRSREQTGNYALRRLQMYSIASNTWTDCHLPQHTQFAILIECNNTLYSVSRQGMESYSPELDRWTLQLRKSLHPCQFAVSDNKRIYLFNLEDGGIQIINTEKLHDIGKNQMIWLNRFDVLSCAKLSRHDVFLSARSSTGLMRKIINVQLIHFTDASKRMCYGTAPVMPKQGVNYPSCINPDDPWELVCDRSKNDTYVLAKWSAVTDCPAEPHNKLSNAARKDDGVIPFYKIDSSKTWQRQASLPEVMVGWPRQNIHLCISDGHSSMATSLP